MFSMAAQEILVGNNLAAVRFATRISVIDYCYKTQFIRAPAWNDEGTLAIQAGCSYMMSNR